MNTVATVALPRLLAVLAANGWHKTGIARRGKLWTARELAGLAETIMRGRSVHAYARKIGRSPGRARSMAYWMRERGLIWMPWRVPL